MDKASLITNIRSVLESELETLQASAADARAAATHEEAKPENQYDTRGLEASYLAGAQAGRAADLAHRIHNLDFVVLKDYGPEDPIGLAAVVELDDGEQQRSYFLSPEGGGQKHDIEGRRILVITPQSPIGRALIDKHDGDLVQVPLRGKVIDMEIVSVE